MYFPFNLFVYVIFDQEFQGEMRNYQMMIGSQEKERTTNKKDKSEKKERPLVFSGEDSATRTRRIISFGFRQE